MGFEEEDWQGKGHSHHLRARIYTFNLTYPCWCSAWSLSWHSDCRVSPLYSCFLFPCSTFWKEVTICSPHLKNGHYISPPLRQSVYSVNYFFNNLFISVWTYRVLFNIIYFIAHIVPSLAIGGSFTWSLCPFDILSLLCTLSPSLFPGNTLCPKLILFLSSPSPTTNHFSKEPTSFIGKC